MRTTQDLLLRVSLPEPIPGLHRIASRFLAGPCNLCGGRDRCQIRLGDGTTPDAWLCRTCTGGRDKDAITYVMRRDGCGFRAALTRLGAGPDHDAGAEDLDPAWCGPDLAGGRWS